MIRKRGTILIVDDEPTIIRFIRANLEANGFQTLSAMDGVKALEMIERELPDLIILDIKMPKMDGLEVCRRLRQWSQIPIIMLSARGDEADKVECLNLGADDYIIKPFGVEELIARVRTVLKRTRAALTVPAQPCFTSRGIKINFVQRRVTVADREVKLTPTEYNLLQELALSANKVLTHSVLLGKVWGPEYGQEKEYLRVFVNRLRRKLEPHPENPEYIITIPGMGYQFRDRA